MVTKLSSKGEIFKIRLAHLVHLIQFSLLIFQLVFLTLVLLVLTLKLIVGVRTILVNLAMAISRLLNIYPFRPLLHKALFPPALISLTSRLVAIIPAPLVLIIKPIVGEMAILVNSALVLLALIIFLLLFPKALFPPALISLTSRLAALTLVLLILMAKLIVGVIITMVRLVIIPLGTQMFLLLSLKELSHLVSI